jgi:plastocyanin
MRARARLLALAAGLAVAASLAGAAPRGRAHVVEMKGKKYRPDSLAIAAGDTVTWANLDDEPHSVTIDASEFDSGDIAPGQKFRWTFRQKGRLRYHCEVHPRMAGTLIVR